MRRLATRSGALALALLGLAACVTNGATTSYEGIGFREARFNEISAMRTYRECRDEAVSLDELARADGSRGRYLASAKLLEKCESELGAEARGVAVDERMRAYALSVQNYFKAGEMDRARENLGRFRQAFPENDLYYPDGSSFTATMEVLLGQKKTKGGDAFAMLNVNDELKDEVHRIDYWRRN
jgi:hypothetical protein